MITYWQRIKEIIGPAKVSDFDKVGQKSTRGSFEKFIFTNSDKNSLLLDAGCNTGVEAYRLIEKEYKGIYFGVDNNAKAIKLAKSNQHQQYYIKILTELSRVAKKYLILAIFIKPLFFWVIK